MEVKVVNKVTWIAVWPQWLAAVELFLLSWMLGVAFGWISPFLAKLASANPPFEVTKEETTWIASLISMSRPLGTISASLTHNYFGSKVAVYICGFFYLFAWICLVAAKSIPLVFVSLFCSGLGMGNLQTSYPMYIGEISNSKIRGSLVSFISHGIMIGALAGNIMGAYLEPWQYGAINLIPATLFLTTFFVFPQSPHHLLCRKKRSEAEIAFKFYNRDRDADKDLNNLEAFLNKNPRLSFWESLKMLNSPVNRKTLLMVNVAYSLVQLGGIYTVLQYSEIIFREAKVDVILPSTLVTIMSAIGIPFCWISMCISDKFNRTTMLFAACIILSLAFLCWGINYHLLDLSFSDPSLQWLAIVAALLFRMSINISLVPTAAMLLSELFAPNVKAVGSGLTNIFSAICAFISSKNFQVMADHMTYKYLFYLLALSILLVGIYIIIFLPETRGKTLQEIQAMLNSKQSKGAGEPASNVTDAKMFQNIDIFVTEKYCSKL